MKRIPGDIRERLVGRELEIPVGSETVRVKFAATMDSIRFSLRTSDPPTAKLRQADAVACVEAFFKAVREDRPVMLTRRQAVALSHDIYSAWSGDREPARQALHAEHTEAGWLVSRGPIDPETESKAAKAAYASFKRLEESEDPADKGQLDRAISPLIDRVLARHGVMSVDADSRALLFEAFMSALRDAFAIRPKRIKGDFTPDPNASRFPPFEAPEAEKVRKKTATLMGLVEDWWTEASATVSVSI